MTFQIGNKGGGKRKEKLFYDALMMEAKAAEDSRGFRVVARKLLDLAVSGDIQAIKEVANRVDGQSVAQIEATIENNLTDDELTNRIRQLVEFAEFSLGGIAGTGGSSDREETPSRPN